MGIETAMMAMAVVGAGAGLMSGVSQFNQGIAANKAAKIAAANEEKNGQVNADIKRRQGNIFMGNQRASFGAMGMDIMGNALDVVSMSAQENELEAQSILSNSRFKAYDYRLQGKQAASAGRMALYSSIGQAATTGLMMGAGGGMGAGNMTTASNNFAGANGAALAKNDAFMGSYMGVKPTYVSGY